MPDPYHLACRINQKRAGNPGDAPLLRVLVVPTAAVVILRPGEVALLGDVDHLIAIVVEADADDDQSLVAVLGVGLDHVARLGHARSAPGGPEVDQNQLAAERLEVDVS